MPPTDTLARAASYPVPAWAALLSLVAAAAVSAALRRRPATPAAGRGTRAETGLTIVAAAIATVMAGTGMWQVVADAVDLPVWLQAAVFAFLEVAILASAIRARRALRQTGSTGVDGAAVWVLAALSAALSAGDARSGVEVLLRLAAPLVAAWLWERGMAPERRQASGWRPPGVAWRVSPARLLVRLRLADPAERGLDEVDRARRIARLTRAAWRHHTLAATGAASWRQRRSAGRLRRHTLAAVEHLHLGEDAGVRDLVRQSLASLYQVTAGTAPGALTDLTQWAPTPAPSGLAQVTVPELVHFGHAEQDDRPAGTGMNSDRLNAASIAAGSPSPAEDGGQEAAAEQPARGTRPAPAGGVRVDEHPGADRPEPTGIDPDRVAAASKRLHARRTAEAHLARTGRRPTARRLAALSGVSTGTAQAALTDLAAATVVTDSDSHRSVSERSESTSQTADESPSTHLSDPAPVPQPKIKIDYTPRHHDPEEDQLPQAPAVRR